MSLAAGTKLGPYEILAPLGEGGMGEVYRARDTRLGRDVALKILPASFARDEDRLRRFEQEARAVAALSHPNILAIHDIGQHESAPFLVSELLDGASLRDVLDEGVLPPRKVIEYGVQIAQGLAAAHEKGVVHRDLKPENLFVTRDGRVKILDFGLAKLAQASDASSDGVTLTSSHTAAGVVMGTASYMAPEQVKGEPADARTDIFAFGAVLFEMLSGKRAFRRSTTAETMTAVLREDPAEISNSSQLISPALDRIVRRCLEKSPEQRFQSAKDLSFALSALSGSDSSTASRVLAQRGKIPLLLWITVPVALAIVTAGTWFLAKRPVALERQQFAIPVTGEVSHMALSVDGSMLAYVSPDENSGLPMISVQRVGSSAARLLAGTENASYPFWSPDGAYVAFFANGKLMKITASGGTPQVLTNVLSARGGSWGSRNVIIYSPDAGSVLWRISPDGSGAAPVTNAIRDGVENTHRWPLFLPDGDHFIFWGGNFGNALDDKISGLYISSLAGKTKKLLVLCRSSAAYDSRHLYYANDDRRLVSLSFDPATGAASGSPSVIADVVGFHASTYWTAITASENGTLIYNPSTGAVSSVLTWMDRSGKELGRIGDAAVQANPTLSPDGSKVAIDISDAKANNVDVWLESTRGEGNTRFTFSPGEEVTGVWSRDGKSVAYRVNLVDGAGLFVKLASGLEHEQMKASVSSSEFDIIPNSWSADDRFILCVDNSPTGYRLLLVPAEGGKPAPILGADKGSKTNGQISPDGKWLAYASDESGDWEIYVTTFPGLVGKWQVSRGGGGEPRWRGDGKEIFYIGPKSMMMAVPVKSGDTFSTTMPAPLFQIHRRAPVSSTDIFSYDVSKDGTRFLVNRYVKPDEMPPLTILLHTNTPGTL